MHTHVLVQDNEQGFHPAEESALQAMAECYIPQCFHVTIASERVDGSSRWTRTYVKVEPAENEDEKPEGLIDTSGRWDVLEGVVRFCRAISGMGMACNVTTLIHDNATQILCGYLL